jgi:hypothetical protein
MSPKMSDIHAWFAAFYAASDDPSAHSHYTTFYAPTAKLIMGDKTAIGRAGMLPPPTNFTSRSRG